MPGQHQMGPRQPQCSALYLLPTIVRNSPVPCEDLHRQGPALTSVQISVLQPLATAPRQMCRLHASRWQDIPRLASLLLWLLGQLRA